MQLLFLGFCVQFLHVSVAEASARPIDAIMVSQESETPSHKSGFACRAKKKKVDMNALFMRFCFI